MTRFMVSTRSYDHDPRTRENETRLLGIFDEYEHAHSAVAVDVNEALQCSRKIWSAMTRKGNPGAYLLKSRVCMLEELLRHMALCSSCTIIPLTDKKDRLTFAWMIEEI
jgi:hypothetical protein